MFPRTTRVSALVVVALIVAAVAPSHAATVWPKPQSMTQDATIYTLDESSFTLKATGETSDILTSAMARYSKIIFAAIPSAAPSADLLAGGALPSLWIDVKTANQSLDLDTDESYTLSIASPQAQITANTVFGALRGLETFSQLVYTSGGVFMVQKAQISDSPRFHHRGIMIDTARHYLHLNVILENLDVMSYSKFSVLHWHIVDDQSFPYNSTKFPNLALKGSYNPTNHVYQRKEIEQVIEYARNLGIRVVVEFDTPGHTEAWGPGQPGLLTPCYSGGKPDGTFGPINPTLPSTFTFLSAFFEEVSEVFADHYIHLGGDEVSFDCWQSNPAVQAWMAQHNYTDYALLEQYYEQTLLTIVNNLDRGYVVWQEIFDNGLKVRPDTVIDVWKGGWQDEMARVTASGLRAILSSPWYLNYIRYYNIEPLNFTGSAAAKELVMGGEVCMWAEFVDATNFMSRVWPRAASVGERLWSAEDVRDITDATTRLHEFRCKLLHRGVNAEPPSGPSFCFNEFVPTYYPPWAPAGASL